jgi:predicted small integral membrane protein
VGHVLSMDTTFPRNALSAHHVAGVMAGRVCADHRRRGADRDCPSGRTISLTRHLRSDGGRFNRAKRFTIIGAALGFLVRFFRFMIVSGEWYSMWQSPMWNG